MNDSNPFLTPDTLNQPTESDYVKLEKVAEQLQQLRDHPPSVAAMLFKPTSLPLRTGIAAICVGVLVYLSSNSQAISLHWPIATATFFLGSILRDYSYARVFTKWWPANMYFLDWNKIDEFVSESK